MYLLCCLFLFYFTGLFEFSFECGVCNVLGFTSTVDPKLDAAAGKGWSSRAALTHSRVEVKQLKWEKHKSEWNDLNESWSHTGILTNQKDTCIITIIFDFLS